MQFTKEIKRIIGQNGSMLFALMYYYPRRLVLGQKTYRYFVNKYNFTWMNERAIEIPLIWKKVREHRNKNVLELGNVLAHYYPIQHDVLDKYEKALGVINQDVISFHPKKNYDLIVAISTLEHVGWDERKKEKEKILRALQNLRSLLNKNGQIIFTVPIGHNKFLDEFIKQDKLGLTKEIYFLRTSRFNIWEKTTKQKALQQKYGSPYGGGNAILLATISR